MLLPPLLRGPAHPVHPLPPASSLEGIQMNDIDGQALDIAGLVAKSRATLVVNVASQ